LSEDSKRCCNTCPKTGRRCLLENDKDKAKNKQHTRHKYTPKNLLSPSTIEKLMKELTSGGLQSRAGLDNIYIEKGAENFAEMTSLIETLSTFLGDKEIEETLCEEVKKAETFHKVHFERHLRQTNEKHSCMCLHCGFNSAEDPIRCPNDHFEFPCQECQDSFAIFDKIEKLYEEVKQNFENNNIFKVQPEMEDDMLEWKERIIKQGFNDSPSNAVLPQPATITLYAVS
jgi:rubrerythrin